MIEKYGEEQVNLARSVCGVWGVALNTMRSAVSAEKILSTLYGVIYSCRVLGQVELKMRKEVVVRPDDSFLSVLGAVQAVYLSRLQSERTGCMYTTVPLSQLLPKGFDYATAMAKVDIGGFEEDILPGLEEGEKKAYGEMKDDPDFLKWGFFSDLLVQYRLGRPQPKGMGGMEVGEFVTSADFLVKVDEEVEEDELYSKSIRLVKVMEKAVLKVLDVMKAEYEIVEEENKRYVVFGKRKNVYSYFGAEHTELDFCGQLVGNDAGHEDTEDSGVGSEGNTPQMLSSWSEDLEERDLAETFRQLKLEYLAKFNKEKDPEIKLRMQYGTAEGEELFKVAKPLKRYLISVNDEPLGTAVEKAVELAYAAVPGSDRAVVERLCLARWIVHGKLLVRGKIKTPVTD